MHLHQLSSSNTSDRNIPVVPVTVEMPQNTTVNDAINEATVRFYTRWFIPGTVALIGGLLLRSCMASPTLYTQPLPQQPVIINNNVAAPAPQPAGGGCFINLGGKC